MTEQTKKGDPKADLAGMRRGLLSGGAQDDGKGVGRRHPGGLDRRGVDAPGRRDRARALFDRRHRLASRPCEGVDLFFQGERLGRVSAMLPSVAVPSRSGS